MGSVYDIAHYFITKNTSNYYPFDQAVDDFKNILAKGYLENEIYDILKNKKIDVNKTSLMSMFRGPIHKMNLLSPYDFYYHNMLRCMSRPALQEWDMNAGTIVNLEEPYFLEMRASFTIAELIKYYNERFNLDPNKMAYTRVKGSFEFLIKKHGIDLVLFMIDAAADHHLSEDLPAPPTPVTIAEYEPQARDRLNLKINETKIAGDDKIVIKDRVFDSGNGLQNDKRSIQEEYFNYN